jgi:hypothetical protein
VSSSSSSRVRSREWRFSKQGSEDLWQVRIGDRRRAGARGGRGKQNKHTLTRHSGRDSGGRETALFGAIDCPVKIKVSDEF